MAFPVMAVMMLVSAAMAAKAQQDAGRAAKQAADARAQSLEAQATQALAKATAQRAIGQREAFSERRQEQLVSSRALALAAASGAGVADPGVENIFGDIGQEGEFRALARLFTRESRAVDLETAASYRMFEGVLETRAGEVALDAAYGQSQATMFKGVISAAGSSSKSRSPSTSPRPDGYSVIKKPDGGTGFF